MDSCKKGKLLELNWNQALPEDYFFNTINKLTIIAIDYLVSIGLVPDFVIRAIVQLEKWQQLGDKVQQGKQFT